MRITSPSFKILDELDQESLPVRIEFCGRICYKSEDKIDRDSAIPFVRKMAEHGHNSVLEMGVVTVVVDCVTEEPITELYLCQPKFLNIARQDNNKLLITGSIRAFREMLLFHPDNQIITAIAALLAESHPYFFETIMPQAGFAAQREVRVKKIELSEVDQWKDERLAQHRHVAVKFIVNRAVTHELVRHRPCAFLQESQRYCRYSADKFGNEVTFIKPLFYQEGSPEFEAWEQAMQDMERIYLQLLETSTPQAARTVLPNSCKTEIIVYANLAEWRHILSLRTPKAAEPSMREVMIPLHEELTRRYPTVFSQSG